MKNAREFCELLKLDESITNDIAALILKVENTLGDKLLLLAEEAMKEGLTEEKFQSLLRAAESFGEQIGEHKFRMQLAFAYYAFALLEEKYERAGIEKWVYEETVLDFKFRVLECLEVYHFVGIFVAWWYRIFCDLSLHKIDELEFERTVANFEYSKKGVRVERGDPIIALHIPPKFKMSRETVTRAIKASYEFYGFSGRVAYQCDSWLLYPDFEELFVDGGNVKEFRSFFDVLSSVDHESFEDCWRVFKVGKIESLDALPTDTRLQRNILNHLKRGGKTGDGFGVLVFDGENIV